VKVFSVLCGDWSKCILCKVSNHMHHNRPQLSSERGINIFVLKKSCSASQYNLPRTQFQPRHNSALVEICLLSESTFHLPVRVNSTLYSDRFCWCRDLRWYLTPILSKAEDDHRHHAALPSARSQILKKSFARLGPGSLDWFFAQDLHLLAWMRRVLSRERKVNFAIHLNHEV
jgi:hypothetical protein